MFLSSLLFFIAVLNWSLCSPLHDDSETTAPVVQTVQGTLRGSINTTRTGRPIFFFRGIPFAQPPVGNLRFQAPTPIEHWDGIRNATEDGASCPQPFADFPLPTSEDCLFLNVYTNKLPSKEGNPNRPVVVFFHPGGFFSVSGDSDIYGPQYLLDEDIVLVTSNYRLAALGFLSTGDEVLPGNYGLKDQVAVLKWIKQNIVSFGGNSNSVTIAGYSAGSVSVMLHLTSPMSQGLFHRAIAMSAAPFWELLGKQKPFNLAKRQAELLNCPSDTSQKIKECLMKKDAQEISLSYSGLAEWGYEPMLIYAPVVEPILHEERFLIDDPVKLFLSGNFSNVPLMTGITRDEFSWKALSIIQNNSWAEDLQNNFNHVAPIAFLYERDTERSHMISRELRRFYLKDQPITNASLDGLGKLFADSIIGFPEHRAAKVISQLSSAPVYYYRFSYEGRYSFVTRPGTDIPYGVVHHDELIYLFYNSFEMPYFNDSYPEIETLKRLTKIWANFIQEGNPTPKKSNLFENVIWEPLTPENRAYLDIGSHLEMKTGLYEERMAVWERLFPLPSISGHDQNNNQNVKG